MKDLGGARDEDPFEQTWACAVCGRVLEIVRRGQSVEGFVHPGEMDPGLPEHLRPDHAAVPVAASEVLAETVCDFCGGARPSWLVPIAPFTGPDLDLGEPTDERPERNMGKDWAACEVCARAVRKERWDALGERMLRSVAARHRVSAGAPELAEHISALVSHVREFQYAPVRRIEPTAS